MKERIMKLPICIYVDLRERVEDVLSHVIHVQVHGADASAVIAVIESDFFQNPKVVSIEQNGLVHLDADLRDRFLIGLFKLAFAEMLANDGSAIEWTISDISRFLRSQFLSADAAAISVVLGNYTSPELEVRD